MTDPKHDQDEAQREMTPAEKRNQEVRDCKEAEDPRACLKAIAEQRGYKPGWVTHILRAWNLDD